MLESALQWLVFAPTSLSTCGTSWQPFLLSLSPAVCALLSATALWVASRARSTSKDAQQTSAGAVSLSLLASPSHLASADPAEEHPSPRG
jgi:NO-binding membrane sensor protein with MHYT domain